MNAFRAPYLGDDPGKDLYELMRKLFPICRSITGNGVRQTLKLIQEIIPLAIHEVPTGTQVFDWSVPREWNIQDAYIKNAEGERVVDFQKSNLHVMSYSVPVKAKMNLAQLREHIHTLPEYPDWIPYRTSYYKDNWGFCLQHNEWRKLEEEEYEVCIDSSLEDGSLTYGELLLEGQTSDEVLVSCHVCHPSLCNDNLSGIAVATFLAKMLATCSLRYSYRFLFIPGTIGSIAWLSAHQSEVHKIKHGFVLTGVGDAGGFTYKKSRRGNAVIDQVFQHVLKHTGKPHRIMDFVPYGYDERQYCSPGFNLPVGCLMRTPHGEYAQYHTSGDNLEFVQPQFLGESFALCLEVLETLEQNRTFVNQNPYCEPQLGRRGIYRTIAGQASGAGQEMPMRWVLNLSDGRHSLLDIAERSGYPFATIQAAGAILQRHGLLKEQRRDQE